MALGRLDPDPQHAGWRGHVREDIAERSERDGRGTWLHGERVPAAEQRIKLQLEFASPRETLHANEPTTWCLMGGRVLAVGADGAVLTEVSASSDLVPVEMARGFWFATLRRDVRLQSPWIVRTIAPRIDTLPLPEELPPPIDMTKRAIVLPMLVLGAEAVGLLDALAAELRRPAVGMQARTVRDGAMFALSVPMAPIRGFSVEVRVYADAFGARPDADVGRFRGALLAGAPSTRAVETHAELAARGLPSLLLGDANDGAAWSIAPRFACERMHVREGFSDVARSMLRALGSQSTPPARST